MAENRSRQETNPRRDNDLFDEGALTLRDADVTFNPVVAVSCDDRCHEDGEYHTFTNPSGTKVNVTAR